MGWTTTTILIGNNIANVSYSAATAALSVHLFSQNEIASVVWSCLAAFVVLYTSEFIPKLLCSARPLRRSLLLSGPFCIISFILRPVTFIAIKVTDFFVPPKKTKDRLTAGDLIRILEDRKDGVCLSDVESALIGRIVVLRAKGKKITPEALLDAVRD
jgi:CBS domain containing-hemolysin-like protein